MILSEKKERRPSRRPARERVACHKLSGSRNRCCCLRLSFLQRARAEMLLNGKLRAVRRGFPSHGDPARATRRFLQHPSTRMHVAEATGRTPRPSAGANTSCCLRLSFFLKVRPWRGCSRRMQGRFAKSRSRQNCSAHLCLHLFGRGLPSDRKVF